MRRRCGHASPRNNGTREEWRLEEEKQVGGVGGAGI